MHRPQVLRAVETSAVAPSQQPTSFDEQVLALNSTRSKIILLGIDRKVRNVSAPQPRCTVTHARALEVIGGPKTNTRSYHLLFALPLSLSSTNDVETVCLPSVRTCRIWGSNSLDKPGVLLTSFIRPG